MILYTEKNHVSFKELFTELKQEICKVSLEYLVTTESKEFLKTNKQKKLIQN